MIFIIHTINIYILSIGIVTVMKRREKTFIKEDAAKVYGIQWQRHVLTVTLC